MKNTKYSSLREFQEYFLKMVDASENLEHCAAAGFKPFLLPIQAHRLDYVFGKYVCGEFPFALGVYVLVAQPFLAKRSLKTCTLKT